MNIDENADQLKKIALFSGTDRCQLKLLAFTSEALCFNPGEYLFKMHDIAENVYVILEGEVDIVWDESPESTVSFATVGKNNVLGEIGVFLNRPRSSSIVARSKVQTLKIPANRFIKLVTESPNAAIEVMRQLSLKFSHMNQLAISAETELRELRGHKV